MIIAHLLGTAAQATIDGLAIAFIVARILHAVFYIADKSLLRTSAWCAGSGRVIGLFVVSA